MAVTLHGADVGDTSSLLETALVAATQLDAAAAPAALAELVADRGYHSNQILVDLDGLGLRSYLPDPDRGRRSWVKTPAAAQARVYGNRRRIRGARGRRLLRQRGESIERSFAHMYDTGAMRRTHLRCPASAGR